MKSKCNDTSVIDISVDDYLLNIDKCKKIRFKYKNMKIIELVVSSCKYCHKPTFSVNKAKDSCRSKECQRKSRNERENIRQNSPYRKPITSIYNYISTYRTIFREKVNDDPFWVSKYDIEAHRIKGIVKAEVKRREEANISPDDDYMKQFLIDNKHDMYTFIKNLLSEYETC